MCRCEGRPGACLPSEATASISTLPSPALVTVLPSCSPWPSFPWARGEPSTRLTSPAQKKEPMLLSTLCSPQRRLGEAHRKQSEGTVWTKRPPSWPKRGGRLLLPGTVEQIPDRLCLPASSQTSPAPTTEILCCYSVPVFLQPRSPATPLIVGPTITPYPNKFLL